MTKIIRLVNISRNVPQLVPATRPVPQLVRPATRPATWIFRKTQWIALFSTDLDLTTEQIIEYYGARWKIESGFKEIKQDIGSSKSQTRNAHAVINHINFSMMAATIT